MLASRHFKKEKASFPVDVRRSKTSLLKLPNRVFERRTSTGSGLFAFLGGGFSYIFEQIVFVRVKTLGITNLLASRHFKREKASFPVDVRRSKTSLLKLPNRVFERRTSTGSGLFAFLGGGFSYIFEQIVFVRVKTLSITNLAALRYFKKEKASLPVDVSGRVLSPLRKSKPEHFSKSSRYRSRRLVEGKINLFNSAGVEP